MDIGLATGSSMRAAAAALRQEGPARIVVAVPIAPQETCDELRTEADDIVCALTPEPFYAVGLWYEDFRQTTDEEVHELLERAARELPAAVPRRGAMADAAGSGRGEGEGEGEAGAGGETHD